MSKSMWIGAATLAVTIVLATAGKCLAQDACGSEYNDGTTVYLPSTAPANGEFDVAPNTCLDQGDDDDRINNVKKIVIAKNAKYKIHSTSAAANPSGHHHYIKGVTIQNYGTLDFNSGLVDLYKDVTISNAGKVAFRNDPGKPNAKRTKDNRMWINNHNVPDQKNVKYEGGTINSTGTIAMYGHGDFDGNIYMTGGVLDLRALNGGTIRHHHYYHRRPRYAQALSADLAITGTLGMTGSTAAVTLTPTDYGSCIIGGGVTLSSTPLTITTSGSPTFGNGTNYNYQYGWDFDILAASSITGNWKSVSYGTVTGVGGTTGVGIACGLTPSIGTTDAILSPIFYVVTTHSMHDSTNYRLSGNFQESGGKQDIQFCSGATCIDSGSSAEGGTSPSFYLSSFDSPKSPLIGYQISWPTFDSAAYQSKESINFLSVDTFTVTVP